MNPYKLSIPLRMKPHKPPGKGANPELGLSIPLRMKLELQIANGVHEGINFQFLWGWNMKSVNIRIWLLCSFNSFEDETYYWMEEWRWGYWRDFQFLWGWNTMRSLRMVGRYWSFNSFEDETLIMPNEHHLAVLHLSIPLRMKLYNIRLKGIFDFAFNSFEDETRREGEHTG